MNQKYKEICRILQIILWIWFGIITSFVSVNVVNIARLEEQIKMHEKLINQYNISKSTKF